MPAKTALSKQGTTQPQPWEQQQGEPNMWYDRFFRFCLYGSSRTVSQCFRDTMAEQEATRKVPIHARKPRTKPSGAWWRVARKYQWWERAAAWDAYLRQRAQMVVEEALNLACQHSLEGVNFLVNLMHGKLELEREDGQKITIYLGTDDLPQMRLAVNSILNRAGVVYDGPKASEEDGEIEIVGIKLVDYGD